MLFKNDNQLRIFHLFIGTLLLLTVLSSPVLKINLLSNEKVHLTLSALTGVLASGAILFHGNKLRLNLSA